MARTILAIAALTLAACSSSNTPGNGDAGPCGACPTGQGCDLSQGKCTPGANEGALCGADAPVGQPTVCVDGFDCGFVAGGTNVCTKLCNTASDCAMGQSCYAATQNGVTRQYCATPVGLGAACGPVQLRQCAGSNGAIVSCIEGADGGICMQRCNRTTACPSGQACSVSFSDGNGVCGAVTQPGSRCDQSQFAYCNSGQVCIEESGTSGVCHIPCDADAGGPSACSGGAECIPVDPCDPASQPFCATPQPVDAGCAAADDAFCGHGEVCVNFSDTGSTVLVCKPECSDAGSTCDDGTTCQAITGWCQDACFNTQ